MKTFVTLGPESTGKTELCKQLANYFKSQWLPEYAREHLEKNGMDYTYDDLLHIAKEHQKNILTAQEKKIHTNLFVDTDMYVMQVWCEYVFDQCHNYILQQIPKTPITGYFLMRPDVPWVKDNLREYPDEETRWKLFYYYKTLAIESGKPWVEIKGNYKERLELAKDFVKSNG
jgi:NadR type nicotinamide-nucleotide adenylyltransferase